MAKFSHVRDCIIEAIEKKNIKPLNVLYHTQRTKIEYCIDTEIIVKAMMLFDKNIMTRIYSIVQKTKFHKIKEAFSIIIKNNPKDNIEDILYIIIDNAHNTMLIDILIWIIGVQNYDFLYINKEIIKKLICECQKRYKTISRDNLLSKIENDVQLINNAILPLQIDIIFFFKKEISLEELVLHINSFVSMDDKNVIKLHIIIGLFELIKQNYGIKEMIKCHANIILSNIIPVVKYEELYFILTKINTLSIFSTFSLEEQYSDNKKIKYTIKEVLNNIIQELINKLKIGGKEVYIMPYIMLMMKQLNIKLYPTLITTKADINTQRYVILSIIASEHNHSDLYKMMLVDKKFYSNKDKKRTEILIPIMEEYITKSIIHIISQYVGCIIEKELNTMLL